MKVCSGPVNSFPLHNAPVVGEYRCDHPGLLRSFQILPPAEVGRDYVINRVFGQGCQVRSTALQPRYKGPPHVHLKPSTRSNSSFRVRPYIESN